MLNWMELHNLKKIQVKMENFYKFKILKAVYSEWVQITNKNNGTRMKIVKVR